MRQYRGISKATKTWVYGWYWQNLYNDESFIMQPHKFGLPHVINSPVIPETVGQQVGLKDKNGKEIYEGDIIRWELGNPCVKCEHQPLMQDTVKFGALGATVMGYRIIDPQHNDWLESAIIIGTIHDKEENAKKTT